MEESNSLLRVLIGRRINRVDSVTANIIPLAGDKATMPEDLFIIGIQLYVDNYVLNIYNQFQVLPVIAGIKEIEGEIIEQINETKYYAELYTTKYRIKVDLRDEAYIGPEAMVLYGPDNFWNVWN